MAEKITSTAQFRRWVRVQVGSREMTMAQLAREIHIPQTRVSEAIHGENAGNKYILPIIQELGGDAADFEEFFKAMDGDMERTT